MGRYECLGCFCASGAFAGGVCVGSPLVGNKLRENLSHSS